jgi:uncharacterized protein (DUF1499 family)
MKLRIRKMVSSLIAVLVLLPILVIVAGQLGAFSGSQPADLGVKNGRLKPPSSTPNSVSSQAALYPDHPQAARAAIEPLRYSGDGKAAMRRLAGMLRGMERTTLITDEPGYLYAQCTTPLMRFTDDLEFSLDAPAGVIHVRSASRLGYGDRGVNRARVEAIRARFNGSAHTEPAEPSR